MWGCFLPQSSVLLPSCCNFLNCRNTNLPKNSCRACVGGRVGEVESGPGVSLGCFTFAAGTGLIWSHRALRMCTLREKPAEPANWAIIWFV